jgi:hypothetical protein
MDYGEASDRSVAMLVAWSPEAGAYVLGEWCGDGRTPLHEQAVAVRAMVRRQGLHLRDIRHLIGDINSAGGHGFVGSMNEAISQEIHKVAARERDPALPSGWRFVGANKRKGSVEYRMRMLNGMLANRHLHVDESCNRLISSMRAYSPKAHDHRKMKDPLDALNYVLEQWVRATTPQPAVVEFRR